MTGPRFELTSPRQKVSRLPTEPPGRPVVYACMYGHYIYLTMDQPGKIANPARGQLNREMSISLIPFAPENLVSRDGFGCPVPRQPAYSPHSG